VVVLKTSEDYLWNQAGERDPEVERLETLLGSFRLQPSQLVWDETTTPQWSLPSRAKLRMPAMLALATVFLIAVAFFIRGRFEWLPGKPWQVSALRGAPRLAGKTISGDDKLAVGQTIETDATSRVRVHVAELGVVDIEPDSRVRLIATHEKRHRMRLEYGTISAHMWAPPFSLAVETSSAVLFDLGCAFTLHVEKGGRGIVYVTSGWVEFETPSRNIVIPAGAQAVALPLIGPGTPYYSDATTTFKAAVTDFDTHPGDEAVRTNALRSILETARSRDAVTLLTLLNQVSPLERRMIVDRLDRLVPLPAGYTRDEVVALQTDALNAYWHALHIGNPKSWVMKWKDALMY
jgi:hypothetical protein